MKEEHQHSPSRNPRQETIFVSRLYTTPISFAFLLIASCAILLAVSYSLGYQLGSSFSTKDISKYMITARSLDRQLGTWCSDPVPPELVHQVLIDFVYNGTSPYEGFAQPTIRSPLQPKRIKGWSSYEAIYKSLIHRVKPKTIIKFNTLGESSTYIANVTRQLGLNTQILCLDDFHRPRVRDLFKDEAMSNGSAKLLNLFMQNVISHNATESILPVPMSTDVGSERLCEWGIFGDLIEVDAGRDFYTAWLDINRAYQLLRPGGVLFGHNYFTTSYSKGVREAVRLFARVNRCQFKANRQYWMIESSLNKVKWF